MIGIYCRTSKARKNYTIENQKDSGIKFAKSIGQPFRIYVDDGVSGTLDESSREGVAELFNDMRSGKLTAIYAVEQSRIARDTPTWHLFVSLCLNFKVKFYQGGSEYPLDNPTNRMLAELMSVVNAFYAQLTSQKVKAANTKKVLEGKTHGIKPFGYKRDANNNYAIFEEEAIHVKRMFELSLSGLGTYSIANILNNEGVPTKFKRNYEGVIKRKDLDTNTTKEFKKENVTWRGSVISDILKNPIYKGTRIWKMYEDIPEFIDGRTKKNKRLVDEIVTTDHVPPIVDKVIWEKVQLNFKNNKKNVGPKEYYHYLLNGLVFCEKCGHEYRGKKRPKGNDLAYKCTNKRYPNAKCDNRGISIPKLETFILRLLLLDKDSLSLFRGLPNKPDDTENLIKSLEIKNETFEDYSRKIKLLVQMAVDFDEDIKEVSNKISDLKQKQNRIASEIESIQKKLSEESKGNFDLKLIEGQKSTNGIRSKINDPENFELIKKTIRTLIESITIEFQKESETYFLRIRLIGKDEMFYISHNRFTEIWSFTDEKGVSEFTERPKWMNYLGYYSLKIKTFSYKIKIPKEDYIKFD